MENSSISEAELELFERDARVLDRNFASLIPPVKKEHLISTAKKICEYVKTLPKEKRGEREFDLESLANHVLFEFITKKGQAQSFKDSYSSLPTTR